MNATALLHHRMANVAVAALLFLLISLASAADVGRRLDAAPAQSPDRVALTGHVLPALALATPLLDIDGNGDIEPLKDGVLILRYLFGFRGDALINGAVGANPARSTAADIEAYLRGLTP